MSASPNDKNRRIILDPAAPEESAITRAASVIREGGVVVFPTTGLYGLAADAMNRHAVEAVFALKNRPAQNPILVLLPDASHISRIVKTISPEAEFLMEHFWPGGLTIVMEAKETVSERLSAGTGKIGIRVPNHPVARALVRAVKGPITGTSANLSGKPGADHPCGVGTSILEDADLILDAGKLAGGVGSTVVDATVPPIRVLREGAVTKMEIREALQRRFPD